MKITVIRFVTRKNASEKKTLTKNRAVIFLLNKQILKIIVKVFLTGRYYDSAMK